MSTIKFSDGTELPVITAQATQIYAQGAQRQAIEIQIAKATTTYDALDKLTSDGVKTGKLVFVDGDVTYTRDNYTIRADLASKPVEITPATSEKAAVTEERFVIVLAQLTYSEVQAAKLAAGQAAQAQAIAELSVLVAGGAK